MDLTGIFNLIDLINYLYLGAGDVDTSTIKTPDAYDVIIGLTGRKLKV